MSDKVTVGCDPEFFIRPYKVEEREVKTSSTARSVRLPLMVSTDVVPICGIIGGTKREPIPIEKMDAGFTVQEDGVACEFNIPPQTDAREFSAAVQSALTRLGGILKKKNYLVAANKRSVNLLPEWTEKWPNLLQIGCDPDFSAYETSGYRKLDMSKIKDIRGAGGHIHIGYPHELCEPPIMARLLDCVLAIPYLDEDSQGERRAFWGQPGLYRTKDYGIEYRTLSNFWIWQTGRSAYMAAHCIALIESLKRNMVQWQAFYNTINWDNVVRAISEEDLALAKKLMGDFMDVKVYSETYARASALATAKPKTLNEGAPHG